ncbi:hypothetical protein [Flavobacterium cyclinae]|uniref:hypothetical protein n=1 Tax=Flavobacterium cyclinae TaxID=2895947 RepID=UPI001E50AE31|nr:hypothetical protein [Flavobacterium cyclinae]UGS19788.1 hypothetical protein LOS86_07085 [Flavobacterium cyclinae]
MKTEKTLSLIFILSLIFKLMHWPGAGPLMIISLLGLAFCYFPFGFYFFSDKNFKTQNIGISIVFGWMLSISIIGILFKLMFWPGAAPMLIVGATTSFILAGVAVILFAKSTDLLKNYYKNLLIRTVVFLVLSVGCLILPNSVIINHYYSTQPELKELYLRQQENPQDESIQKEIEEYHAKQYERETGKRKNQ